jgi:hypothetical protein
MPLYTFYPTLGDGLCSTFQSLELDCDGAAADRALQILDEHPSAATVVVYCEQQKLLTRGRSPRRLAPTTR